MFPFLKDVCNLTCSDLFSSRQHTGWLRIQRRHCFVPLVFCDHVRRNLERIHVWGNDKRSSRLFGVDLLSHCGSFRRGKLLGSGWYHIRRGRGGCDGKVTLDRDHAHHKFACRLLDYGTEVIQFRWGSGSVFPDFLGGQCPLYYAPIVSLVRCLGRGPPIACPSRVHRGTI